MHTCLHAYMPAYVGTYMHTYRYIQTYIHIFTDTHTRRFSQCVFSALRIVTRLYEVPSSSWVPTYADARRKHAQMHPQKCHSGTLKKGCDDVVVQFTLERVRQWERQTETEREREGERERHPKRAWDTWLLHVSVILYIHASNKCTHTHIYIYFVCMYIYIYIYTHDSQLRIIRSTHMAQAGNFDDLGQLPRWICVTKHHEIRHLKPTPVH